MTRPRNNTWLLPVGLGTSDGILNALVLASASLVHDDTTVTFTLAARVAAAALVTAIFTYFVAEYANLRSQLRHAEHQLNITEAGRLATSHLGHRIRTDAARATLLAGTCSFLGALGPLLLGAATPSAPWLCLPIAIGALGGLGAILARAVHGTTLKWATIMMASGTVITAIGIQLDIA
jgi:predicted membrane protein (TIGR00267 family)